MNQPSEPIFNIPAVVVATLASFVGIYLVRTFLLTDEQDVEILMLFAFIPARYEAMLQLSGGLPGGFGAQVWTFITYAFLHADLAHLGMNSLWYVPFGSAVARRFGVMRFMLFFAATAAAGAAAHLVSHGGEIFPVIGASAVVSGLMAAAIRFTFQPNGPIALWQQRDDRAYMVPALPLMAALRDPRILAFLGIWFGVNLIFGIGSVPLIGEGQTVAWEAHIGGFLAGLLLFSLFDPIPRAASPVAESREDLPQ